MIHYLHIIDDSLEEPTQRSAFFFHRLHVSKSTAHKLLSEYGKKRSPSNDNFHGTDHDGAAFFYLRYIDPNRNRRWGYTGRGWRKKRI